MFNLVQNVELCPHTTAINECVRNRDCTRYVKSGWFGMFMEREGYMTHDTVVQAAQLPTVKLAHIGMWLKLATMEETEEAAVMIAQKTCMLRRDELIDAQLLALKPNKAE